MQQLEPLLDPLIKHALSAPRAIGPKDQHTQAALREKGRVRCLIAPLSCKVPHCKVQLVAVGLPRVVRVYRNGALVQRDLRRQACLAEERALQTRLARLAHADDQQPQHRTRHHALLSELAHVVEGRDPSFPGHLYG